MRIRQWIAARRTKRIPLALVFAASGASLALMGCQGRGAPGAAEAPAKLECTIFKYDGQDFIRTNTTLMTQEGKSAVGTKLVPGSAAYQALTAKHSYSGDATLFGHAYASDYAPLTDASGQLTGAIFVATPK